ncbi:MAG: thiamine phosphate synthase [Magnetococcales bacterium]|nr:thiamine phosphate synthase [Magnetococcales bacterium]
MSDPPRLLLITDPLVCPDIEGGIAAALQGGPFDVVLRNKTASAHTLTAQAHRIKALLRSTGGRLLIHGRADIALAVEADGVHLPECGMETSEVRQFIGPNRLLGRSCHNPENGRRHLLEGGDYVTLSPVFPTASHPEATPLGLERFSCMRAQIPGAVLALGGIQIGNVADTLRAGATGVALIRGILNTPDPGFAVQNLLTHINKN